MVSGENASGLRVIARPFCLLLDLVKGGDNLIVWESGFENEMYLRGR